MRAYEKVVRGSIWPRVSKVTKNGKTAYVVDARINRKGERRFFPSEVDAEKWAAEMRERREQDGTSTIYDKDLADFGWTVKDAIKFSLAHLHSKQKSATVRQAADRLIAAKQSAGRRTIYCQELSRRLGRYVDYLPAETSISETTSETVDAFLTSLGCAPGTRNTYRRDLVTLYSYTTKIGLTATNEAEKTDRTQEADKVPEILQPFQVARLLKIRQDDDLRACHAIGFFAGLRTCEIKRLDWRNVDLVGGYVTVTAQSSKTRSRRLIPIQPNLKQWLAPIAKKSGPVLGVNANRRLRAIRKKAGWDHWPDNAMRHSFVSYRLAKTGNAAETALEAGHAQEILFRHYRQLVTKAAAGKYFKIDPKGIVLDGGTIKVTPPNEDPNL